MKQNLLQFILQRSLTGLEKDNYAEFKKQMDADF